MIETKLDYKKYWENVQQKSPLVHCLTNYVTVNDVANFLLACGGSPIMADDIEEVEDITSISNAVVLNIGTLNQRTIKSMLKSGKKANELSIPLFLDPVGAGASALRTETTFEFLEKLKFTVIRGNISEIKTVALGSGDTKGVDANVSDKITKDNLPETIAFSKALSEKTGAIIATTGPVDIVTDQSDAYVIHNGHPSMSKVSGTGCMVTALVAAYCAANPENLLEATTTAVSAMGLCGELAYRKVEEIGAGTSSYRTLIIDAMSQLKPSNLQEDIKIEIK